MSSVNKKALKQRISERIKAGMITTRLEEFATTHPEDPDYIKKSMTTAQVSAARILLSKVIPDLKQIELDGTIEQTITQITRKVVKPKPSSS